MRTITSAVLGTMRQDEEFGDWWHSAPVPIGLLGGESMPITFLDMNPEKDPDFLAEADTALQHFLQFSEEDARAMSGAIYQNCMEFLNAVTYDEDDQPLWDITDPQEIWNFVEPRFVYVSRRYDGPRDIYVHISCNCEWEQEHGLQLVFRGGKQLTRISAEDGHLTDANEADAPTPIDLSLFKPQ